MKIIGLTGSIGMGKSLTSGIFQKLGTPVFDSDKCVHHLLSGSSVIKAISRTFPEAMDSRTKRIDKKRLGDIIFSDKNARRQLEDILHPMVWKEQKKFLRKCRRAGYKQVVLDIPLLFETGRNQICDKTICVTAPYFLQRQRVLSRPNMTEEKFISILSKQIPDRTKRLLSNVVIQTGIGRPFTIQTIKRLLNRWR